MDRSAEEIRSKLRRNALISRSEQPLSNGHKGAIIHALERAWGGAQMRHVVLGWLFASPFKPVHRKHIDAVNDGIWHALAEWIDQAKVDDVWLVGDEFSRESLVVLNAALEAYSKLTNGERAAFLDDTPPVLVQDIVGSLGGVVTVVLEDDGAHNGVKIEKKAPVRKTVRYDSLAAFLGDDFNGFE
jgi:hypothetical protein